LVHALQKLYQANGVDLDLEIALFTPIAATIFRRPSNRPASLPAAAGHLPPMCWRGRCIKPASMKAEFYSQQALRLGTQDALSSSTPG
jgi:hypothetical protein